MATDKKEKATETIKPPDFERPDWQDDVARYLREVEAYDERHGISAPEPEPPPERWQDMPPLWVAGILGGGLFVVGMGAALLTNEREFSFGVLIMGGLAAATVFLLTGLVLAVGQLVLSQTLGRLIGDAEMERVYRLCRWGALPIGATLMAAWMISI